MKFPKPLRSFFRKAFKPLAERLIKALEPILDASPDPSHQNEVTENYLTSGTKIQWMIEPGNCFLCSLPVAASIHDLPCLQFLLVKLSNIPERYISFEPLDDRLLNGKGIYQIALTIPSSIKGEIRDNFKTHGQHIAVAISEYSYYQHVLKACDVNNISRDLVGSAPAFKDPVTKDLEKWDLVLKLIAGKDAPPNEAGSHWRESVDKSQQASVDRPR